MIIHALREDTDVVIVARDTDVLILMVYAYAKRHVKNSWYMKYGAGKYCILERSWRTLVMLYR